MWVISRNPIREPQDCDTHYGQVMMEMWESGWGLFPLSMRGVQATLIYDSSWIPSTWCSTSWQISTLLSKSLQCQLLINTLATTAVLAEHFPSPVLLKFPNQPGGTHSRPSPGGPEQAWLKSNLSELPHSCPRALRNQRNAPYLRGVDAGTTYSSKSHRATPRLMATRGRRKIV